MKTLAFLLAGIMMYFVFFLIHDILIKWIYCKWKHKHQTKRRCYFWNCKHWHDCPLNYRKIEKNTPK